MSRSSSGVVSADLVGKDAGSCVMRETFEDYNHNTLVSMNCKVTMGLLTMNERPEVLDISAGLEEPG